MKISKRQTLGTILCSMILVLALMFTAETSQASDDPNCSYNPATADCKVQTLKNCYCFDVE